jgi:hypothetical protein
VSKLFSTFYFSTRFVSPNPRGSFVGPSWARILNPKALQFGLASDSSDTLPPTWLDGFSLGDKTGQLLPGSFQERLETICMLVDRFASATHIQDVETILRECQAEPNAKVSRTPFS